MKLSAKFKKILWRGFRATLNFQLFTVALNLLHKVLSWHAHNILEIIKGGHRVRFNWRYKQLKPKYGVFLQSFPVVRATFYITKMTKSFSAIIGA